MKHGMGWWLKRGLLMGGALLAAAGAVAQGYTIQSLGLLAGTNRGRANEVNNKGHVVGTCDNTATFKFIAFSWTPETGMVGYPSVGPAADDSFGEGLNIHDVGTGYETTDNDFLGMMWHGKGVAIVPDFANAVAGQRYMQCNDINDQGAICGTTRAMDGLQIATIYANGMHQLLGRYITDKRSYAHKINNLNHVIGSSSDNPQNENHVVFWNGTQWVELNTLGGTINAFNDLNDSDLIVGASTLPGDTVFHACYWVNATGDPVDLGTLGGNLSNAFAVNNKGVIVGAAELEMIGVYEPFIYRDGTMTSLLDLLPPGTENQWTDIAPYSISDTGYICGEAKLNGQPHPFLMTPDPPPGVVARFLFDGGVEGWTAVTDVPPFEPGMSSTLASALGLSPGGAFPVFSFWQSPEVTVEKGKTYRARFTMTSTVLNSDEVPQFRLRVLQSSNFLAWFTASDSVANQPPAAGETKTYDVVFSPDMTGDTDTVRLFLDLTFFNPIDDDDGTIIMQDATVSEVTVE